MLRVSLVLILISFFTIENFSQQLLIPRPSPKSTVSQFVGVTEITINYNSPGVKGRKIWGDLVPLNKIWRTGANELTTITFSDPVTINRTNLEAGTYGIVTIPNENEWTFILTKDAKVWSSFSYKEGNDAVRFNINPKQSEFTERLTFTFENGTDNEVDVVMRWDYVKISFKVWVNSSELTIAKAKQNLSWSPYMQIAQYCLQSNTNLEEAINWINISTMINENYWNLRIKAQLLDKKGNKSEAVSILEKAIELGNKMENAPFDFSQMKQLLEDWK